MFGIETTKVVKYVSSIHSLNHSFIHSLILASVFVQWKLNNNHQKKIPHFVKFGALLVRFISIYFWSSSFLPFTMVLYVWAKNVVHHVMSSLSFFHFCCCQKGIITNNIDNNWMTPKKKLSEDCHHNNYISYCNIGPFINVSSLLLWWWWL